MFFFTRSLPEESDAYLSEESDELNICFLFLNLITIGSDRKLLLVDL